MQQSVIDLVDRTNGKITAIMGNRGDFSEGLLKRTVNGQSAVICLGQNGTSPEVTHVAFLSRNDAVSFAQRIKQA